MLICLNEQNELPAVAEKVAQRALEIHRAFRKHFGPVKFRAIGAYKAVSSGDDDGYRAAADAFGEASKRLHDAIEHQQNEMRELFLIHRPPESIRASLFKKGTGCAVEGSTLMACGVTRASLGSALSTTQKHASMHRRLGNPVRRC
jgi:hypothetical protein